MNPAGLSQGLQPNNFFIVMPTISRFYGISIRMYFDDNMRRISTRCMLNTKRWLQLLIDAFSLVTCRVTRKILC